MNDFNPENEPTSSELLIALTELYPDATYGAVPVIDQWDAVEAYRAFDDGGLSEAPQALAAYVHYQQHATL